MFSVVCQSMDTLTSCSSILPLWRPPLQPQEACFCSRETKIPTKDRKRVGKSYFLAATASIVDKNLKWKIVCTQSSPLCSSCLPLTSELPASFPSVCLLFSSACKENNSPFYKEISTTKPVTQKLSFREEMSIDSEGKGKKGDRAVYAAQVLTHIILNMETCKIFYYANTKSFK